MDLEKYLQNNKTSYLSGPHLEDTAHQLFIQILYRNIRPVRKRALFGDILPYQKVYLLRGQVTSHDRGHLLG